MATVAHEERYPSGAVKSVWQRSLTAGQYYRQSGITEHAKVSKVWMAGIKPQHDELSQVTNYTASLQRYREYAATTLSTWPAMWAELSKRRWSNARFRLYGGKQRTVAKFWAETVKGARVRCNSAATGRPLALAYGAAGFSGSGSIGSKGVPVKQMQREACKQFPGRVVLVHEFRTSRVSSARTNVVQGQAESFRWLYPVRSMAKRSRIRGLMCSTSNVIKRRFYDRDVNKASMGNEASRAENGFKDVFNPYPAPPPKPPTAPAQEADPAPAPKPAKSRPASAFGRRKGELSPAAQRLADKKAGSNAWLHINQSKVASTAERRGLPGNVRPSTAQPARGLADEMGSLLVSHPDSKQPTAEEKLEEKKAEFAAKISSLISRGVSKVPADMHLPKVPVLPPRAPEVPAAVKASWSSKLQASRSAVMASVTKRLGQEKVYEPLSQEELGVAVQTSLGSTLDVFAGLQGTLSSVVQQGVGEETLQQVLQAAADTKHLTVQEKWALVRHAAEQVLQVYTNRSNARWVESQRWGPAQVLDATATSASVYASAVDAALNQGQVALLFIDDGRLVEGGDSPTEQITSLLSTDLWQAIKALAPHKVPSGHRLERLSVLGRHLLHASVSMDLGYGAAALRNLRVVVAVDQEQEQFLVGELKAWTFFGLDPKNLVVLPLPRFYGFVQDLKQDTLAHVRASSRLMLGTGYAMHLLNSPAQAYTLDSGACNPACLPGTVLEWLRGLKVSWLYAGMFSDVERLRPQALVDADFLAAAMHAADRQGCNMAVEVMMGENERDVRGQDSLVLSRLLPDGSPGGNCNLKASAMRTIANPEAIYVATSRYLFRVQALQRLLSDCATHMPNVRLHGFYAYATFDIADLTTFPDARCAAILGKGARGPPLSEVVYGRAWLAQAAAALEAQDKVNEFRQRAIDLVHAELLGDSPTRALRSLATIPGAAPASTHVELTPRCCSMPSSPTRFRERKQGLQVLLLLAPEHRGLARSALKLARLFIQHIVDRLHVVVIAAANDSKDLAQQALNE
ncbi:hypothetical protein QJQ45_021643, partial [Haematococcus lacustris]